MSGWHSWISIRLVNQWTSVVGSIPTFQTAWCQFCTKMSDLSYMRKPQLVGKSPSWSFFTLFKIWKDFMKSTQAYNSKMNLHLTRDIKTFLAPEFNVYMNSRAMSHEHLYSGPLVTPYVTNSSKSLSGLLTKY